MHSRRHRNHELRAGGLTQYLRARPESEDSIAERHSTREALPVSWSGRNTSFPAGSARLHPLHFDRARPLWPVFLLANSETRRALRVAMRARSLRFRIRPIFDGNILASRRQGDCLAAIQCRVRAGQQVWLDSYARELSVL